MSRKIWNDVEEVSQVVETLEKWVNGFLAVVSIVCLAGIVVLLIKRFFTL